MSRTKTTQRKSTGLHGVPRHQLASRHEGSSSGSNDPIGDLEAQVEQLRSELRHRNRARERDSHRNAELSAEVSRLQYEISERHTTIDWVVNSRSFAWDCEAKALARVAELSASLKNLQAYCNTLHEEVHVLYDRLHPDVPPDIAAMGVGPSGTANEGPDGELDIFRPPPSMNLADERSPEAGNGTT
jgi:DNA anti-recombination protein RmuC